MILKTYFEELILLILVFFIGFSAIIFTSSFSNDIEEKECVKFYKENNYITKSCEIYKEKLEELKNEI